MKKIFVLLVVALVFFSSCGQKAYYETSLGKKKQQFYNDIQYGKNSHPKKRF